MPLYDYRCETHGTFEAYKKVGATTAPCPSCAEASTRQFTAPTFTHSRPYDQAVDGEMNYDGTDVKDRGAGGKAVRVKETGGWRPALTHNTYCVKCNKMRNVAVTEAMVGATLITCEACAYSWLHRAEDAPAPLAAGVEESYRPSKMFSMNPDVPMSGYRPPERADGDD